MDAGEGKDGEELSTTQGKLLIDQIAEVSKPLIILSGGEPLLRSDVFELAEYATEKGLTVAMGTNGTLISDSVARRLKSSGVKAVAVSIDSHIPEQHDTFRGVEGSWERALKGIEACIRNRIRVQVNTTVTPQNFGEIEELMDLARGYGANSFHLFFLVPTGRGAGIQDISMDMYESLISNVLDVIKIGNSKFRIRPVCAPQFMRIASQKGLDLREWGRGCIAGLSYCRICPAGEVTPCPYLPIRLGNIKNRRFKDIWCDSPILMQLRDFDNLQGKCGRCEYREKCGGCRARAYGPTGPSHGCGGLREPEELTGNFLAEEPLCPYIPESAEK